MLGLRMALKARSASWRRVGDDKARESPKRLDSGQAPLAAYAIDAAFTRQPVTQGVDGTSVRFQDVDQAGFHHVEEGICAKDRTIAWRRLADEQGGAKTGKPLS
jgi:hypothetical protein